MNTQNAALAPSHNPGKPRHTKLALEKVQEVALHHDEMR